MEILPVNNPRFLLCSNHVSLPYSGLLFELNWNGKLNKYSTLKVTLSNTGVSTGDFCAFTFYVMNHCCSITRILRNAAQRSAKELGPQQSPNCVQCLLEIIPVLLCWVHSKQAEVSTDVISVPQLPQFSVIPKLWQAHNHTQEVLPSTQGRAVPASFGHKIKQENTVNRWYIECLYQNIIVSLMKTQSSQ